MSDDIVRRLLSVQYLGDRDPICDLCMDAAFEIERLRSELAESARNVISQMAVEDELRALITEWADATDERDDLPGVSYTNRYIRSIGALLKVVGR